MREEGLESFMAGEGVVCYNTRWGMARVEWQNEVRYFTRGTGLYSQDIVSCDDWGELKIHTYMPYT